MSCGGNLGKYRWFWTGNQVGDLNFTGDMNFVGGGPVGSGISAGVLVRKFFQKEISRDLWEYPNAALTQELLDAAFPFIELKWFAEIKLSNVATFRISDRNIYVQDDEGNPRFYEARVQKGPTVTMTLGEWLAPNFEIGDVKLDLNNRDGYFNDWLPQGKNYLQWIGAEVSIRVGFGEKLSNYYEVFRGFVSNKQGVTGTHETISIKCYDRTYEDEVIIPTTTFDRTNHPHVDSEAVGKVLPLIYGDWTTDVGDFGEIPARCGNANDTLSSIYNWIISENPLQEIGNVYLHRGDSVVGKDGPILLMNNAINKQPHLGRVLIPNNIPVLSRVFILLDRARAGVGSGPQTIISESPSQDFVKLGIRIGDVVLKDNDPVSYVITAVGAGSITTATGTFAPQDNFRVITDKYLFRKGDKISVTCKGKDLRVMSITRIADAGIQNSNPQGLSIGLDNSYWFFDNVVKKIYKVSFNNKVLRTINFADIDPSITQLSAIEVAFDETLWILEEKQSKIYRYLLKDNVVGLSFTTAQIDGINVLLKRPKAMCIDDANIITLVDNFTGKFYRFNPFAPIMEVIQSWSVSAFDSLAVDIIDIAADVNKNQICVVDKATNKFYRINETNGTLIADSSFNLTTINSNFTFPNGLGYYLDGTIFILNRKDNAIYNYNEFPDCSNNMGFIARELLQKYAGKTPFDFDLMWNETAREDLSKYKARVYIDEKVSVISHVHKLLTAFSTSAYIRAQKYALFMIIFDNFRLDGKIIREGDIKLNSFNPSKEYNQYFNTATAKYNQLPFSGTQYNSDTYVSPKGVQMSGREIKKELDMSPVYRREDIDKLIPLNVRLAAAEPEFINLSVGFRFLFIQPNNFFNIRFFDYDPGKKSGRRYDNIPAFVRKIEMSLSNMEIKLKLWSLGTTQFAGFTPVGTIAGGEFDQIVLTNLGTPGWISPTGTILSVNPGSVILEDVNSIQAESRAHSYTGKAWLPGYKVAVTDAATQAVLEVLTIDTVVGDEVSFVETPATTILPSVKNSAGFYVSGHFLKYAKYDQVVQDQTKYYSYFTKPVEGYPTSTTEEIEDQRAGKHNFDDQRLPYLLHPKGYIPQI